MGKWTVLKAHSVAPRLPLRRFGDLAPILERVGIRKLMIMILLLRYREREVGDRRQFLVLPPVRKRKAYRLGEEQFLRCPYRRGDVGIATQDDDSFRLIVVQQLEKHHRDSDVGLLFLTTSQHLPAVVARNALLLESGEVDTDARVLEAADQVPVSVRDSGIGGLEMLSQCGKIMDFFECGAGSNDMQVGAAERLDVQPLGSRATERARGGTDGVVEIESVNEEGCAIHRPKKTLRIATRRGPASPQAPLGMIESKVRLALRQVNLEDQRPEPARHRQVAWL